MSFQISIIKKNHILAWMLIMILFVAGMLNYTNDPKKNYVVEVSGRMEDDLGEAVLVDSPHLVSNVDAYVADLQETSKTKST